MVSKNVDLIAQIVALRADRDKHAKEISKIDETLLKISAVLSTVNLDSKATSGLRGKASHVSEEKGQAGPDSQTFGRPRKYRKLGLTATEFVLELAARNGGATTLEINRAWRAEGRGGVANNTIGRLLSERMILRESLQGQRGSRYRLNPNAPGTPSKGQRHRNSPELGNS